MTNIKRHTFDKNLTSILVYGIMIILILMPFHGFFTTWAESNFGQGDLFRIWKEIIILVLSLVAIVLMMRDKKLRNNFTSNFIVQIMFFYSLITALRAVFGWTSGNVNTEATLYGLVANLRFIVIFCLAWVAGQKSSILRTAWQQILLIPGLIVICFGLLQQFFLPKDFLGHFGYGTHSIPVYQSVDQKPEYIRLQSTLRGPNPLGAYMVIFCTFAIEKFMSLASLKNSLIMSSSLIVMFFTYSRSAWTGLIASIIALIFLLNPTKWKKILAVSFICLVALASIVYVFRENNLVQNVVFHSDETSRSSKSSNEVRYSSISKGIKDIISHPLGQGVGSAGPASYRNNKPSKISENYFIQIGQETGLIGLAIYISITVFVARSLWTRRSDSLALILLTSLVGITVVNMISHAWMDDTLVLLWWGLAGVALAVPAILKDKHYGQKTNKS